MICFSRYTFSELSRESCQNIFCSQNAKKDEPSKRAYKYLATLHSDCRDLIALVEETGQVTREIRDIEDQIENERTRDILKNLEKIMVDIKQVEKESAELQEKIKYVENKIVQG